MRGEKKKRLMNKGLEQESVKNKQTMKRIQGSDGQQMMPNITCKIIHVCWLHVNYIKTLISHLQIPQVYPKVISRNKCLTITAQGLKTTDHLRNSDPFISSKLLEQLLTLCPSYFKYYNINMQINSNIQRHKQLKGGLFLYLSDAKEITLQR